VVAVCQVECPEAWAWVGWTTNSLVPNPKKMFTKTGPTFGAGIGY
jgi:hypothetical protein